MEKIEFSNACYEVLEILKYVKEEDLLKIPKEEIQMLKDNANFNHDFKYNPQKNIKEQQVSKLAKGIIAEYFYKYTASEKQREKIKIKQEHDLKAIEEENMKMYGTDNLFKNKSNIEIKKVNEEKNMQLVEYKKEKWYKRILNKILRILKRTYHGDGVNGKN